MEISVSDDDIAYAERILLPPGETFDEERRLFIRNMGTLDLQAVPGSGKTTALLAKLLILDRYLPFENGSGVLVISHTNAAIDEIRGRIGVHCTSLFRYPNFVGTIQSFVNEFLAIPCYTNMYGHAVTRIDDDIYDQKFAKPPIGIKGFGARESKNALWFLKANKKKIRWSFVDGKAALADGYGGKEIEFKKPRGRTKPENYADWSDEEKNRVRLWVQRFKHAILKSGCLCYEDAYFLARLSLGRNAKIKPLLQQRFAHVYVDEMQDMERHQYELLEDVFYDEGTSGSVFQRIGDRNQSIFDGKTSTADGFWTDRASVLTLSGSYRLSPILAGIVAPFAVSPIRIDGRRKNFDGSYVSVKPRFVVYCDATKSAVIPRFASIIRELINSGVIPASSRNLYKAVAWATKLADGKVRLPDYHPSYSRMAQQKRVDHPNLASHLATPSAGDYALEPIEKAICNALLRILRLEGVEDAAGAHFTRRTMHEFIRQASPNYWTEYQSKMYDWCLDVARGHGINSLADIRSYLPTFLSAFNCKISGCRDFVYDSSNEVPVEAAIPPVAPVRNVLAFEGLEVEVATVHSVKGETHTATLYMETFYEKKGGGGNYESERLTDQLKGQAIGIKPHDLVRQSAKMVYVGFSRPTHLLCFAVHQSRFAKFEADIDLAIWEVVRL